MTDAHGFDEEFQDREERDETGQNTHEDLRMDDALEERDETEQNAQEDQGADDTVEEGDGSGDMHAVQRVLLSKAGLPVKPDTYDGTSEWEEYFNHFEICSELGSWKEGEKTLALAASLHGPARKFYISLPQRENCLYEDLVQQLGNRFGSTRQRSKWLTKFESRTRQPDESVAALGDNLRQMSQKAYPNLDCVAQEALALNQLYKSVGLEMKCRCIDRNCTSIAQAVDIIERYEAVLGESDDKKKMALVVETRYEEDSLGKAIERLTARLDQLEARMNIRSWKGGRQTLDVQKTCFVCGSPEHFMRDCQGGWNNDQQEGEDQDPDTSGSLDL